MGILLPSICLEMGILLPCMFEKWAVLYKWVSSFPVCLKMGILLPCMFENGYLTSLYI